MRFQGRVAFISGGAGAFGIAIAKRIVSEGGTAVLGDLREPEAPASLVERTSFVHLDVTSENSWSAAIGSTVDTFGRLDVLVNAAGVLSRQTYPFDEFPLEEWRRVFSINVEGTLLGTQAAIRVMKENKRGAIVNIGSMAAFMGLRDEAAYGASKATVMSLSKQAAISSAHFGYGVRVNTVHPTFVWTPLIAKKHIATYGSEEAAIKALSATIPLRDLPYPEDVASAVAFLASDDARMITGADLVIDGGRLIA